MVKNIVFLVYIFVLFCCDCRKNYILFLCILYKSRKSFVCTYSTLLLFFIFFFWYYVSQYRKNKNGKIFNFTDYFCFFFGYILTFLYAFNLSVTFFSGLNINEFSEFRFVICKGKRYRFLDNKIFVLIFCHCIRRVVIYISL